MKRSLPVAPALVLAVVVLFVYFSTDGRGLLASGLSYPWLGLAHLIAAVGVAVWAGRLGGDSPVVLPVVFILGVGMGYILAAEGPPLLLFVEPMIWASVLALTFAAVYGVRVPLGDAIGVLVLFGLYHGHALGELGEAGAFLIDLSAMTAVTGPQASEAMIVSGASSIP